MPSENFLNLENDEKITSYSFVLLIVFGSILNVNEREQYIRMEYGGPSDFPVQPLVFYINDYPKDELFEPYYSAYKINRKLFEELNLSILKFENARTSPSEKALGYYTITACGEGFKYRCHLWDKANLEKLLNIIYSCLKNQSFSRDLKLDIDEITKMVW